MALIKCSECGREISDKAPACIHCGCPISVSLPNAADSGNSDNSGSKKSVFDNLFGCNSPIKFSKEPIITFNAVLSGAENESSRQSVFVKDLGHNVEFTVPNTIKNGQSITVPLQNEKYDFIQFMVESVSRAPQGGQTAPSSNKSDQDVIATIDNYKTNWFIRFLSSRHFFSLMLLYIIAVGYFLFEDGLEMAVSAALGMSPFFVSLLIAKLLYPLYHLKNYIRKNNLEDAIRNDTGYMNIAISVYNAMPGKKVLEYIRSLNATAAQRIEQKIAATKK